MIVPATQPVRSTESAVAEGLAPPGVGGFLLTAGVLAMALGLSMSLALLHAGLGLAVAGLLLLRTPIHRLPGFWWGMAYAGWQLASMLTSSLAGGEPLLKRGYGSAYTWLAFYAAIEGFRVARIRLWAVLLMSAGATASMLLAMVQFWVGFGGQPPLRILQERGNRLTSAGFFPLHLTQGFMMTQIALIAWTQPLAKGWQRMVQWAGRLASLACVPLTGGRTGAVAAIAGWSAWFGSPGRQRLVFAAGVGLLGVLLAGAWLQLVRPPGRGTIDALALRDGRIIHWQVAGVLIREHPVLGVGGAKDFKRENNRVLAQLYPDGSQNAWLDAPDAHNSFLGITSEHGIPALVFYLGFLAAVMLHLWRTRQTHPWAWRLGCGLVASALCAGQFEHLAGHSTTCYGLFVPLGFAVAMTLAEKAQVPEVKSPPA